MGPKFVVDVNVGRLAKWLRVLGYDALFVPDIDDGGPDANDARCRGENRIGASNQRYFALGLDARRAPFVEVDEDSIRVV